MGPGSFQPQLVFIFSRAACWLEKPLCPNLGQGSHVQAFVCVEPSARMFFLQSLPGCVQASLLACDIPEARERSLLLSPLSRGQGCKDGLCLPPDFGLLCPQGAGTWGQGSPGLGGLLCHLWQVSPPVSGPSCKMGPTGKLRLGFGDLWQAGGGDRVWPLQQEYIHSPGCLCPRKRAGRKPGGKCGGGELPSCSAADRRVGMDQDGRGLAKAWLNSFSPCPPTQWRLVQCSPLKGRRACCVCISTALQLTTKPGPRA